MNLDLRTLVLIRRRVESAPILLHHDVRTPKARAARINRILAWLGPCGRAVTSDYMHPRSPLPRASDRVWTRHVRIPELA